jgi:hypothetical protein
MDMRASGITSWIIVSLLALSSFLPFGCQRGVHQEKTNLLPETGPNERNVSSFKRANPYTEAGKGLLVRTIFQTDGPQGTRIRIQDFLVAPGQTTVNVSLPGAAVVEVRSGNGSIVVRERREEITSGRTVSISEGESFAIENNTPLPIALRVYLFSAR